MAIIGYPDSAFGMTGVWAIVPAAGTSNRMRRSLNDVTAQSMSSKIFLELADGRSVLYESLKCLFDSGIRNLCIPTRNELLGIVTQTATEVGDWNQLEVIEGGETRFQSVKNGLRSIEGKDPSVVVIHDAARPFASPEMICMTIKKALSGSAAILASPVTSTIKFVSDDSLVVSETPDRKLLWEAQTPQAFPYAALYDSFAKISASSSLLYDDASVFEQAGGSVEVIESPSENIKVTTARDLVLARILFKELLKE